MPSAYLVTDEAVEVAANNYAAGRLPPDPVSQRAVNESPHPERTVVPLDTDTMTAEHEQDDSDAMLWTALVLGPRGGDNGSDLMSRPWIYLRLPELTDQGHVIQVSRGRWRAATDDTA